MNRSELVAAVAAGTGADQTVARRHVDAVFETIIRSVAAGDKVVVTGFGTFERLARPARTIRNPRTGEPMDLEASHAARFSAGRSFKDQVSGSEPASVSAPKKDTATASSKGKDKASAKLTGKKAKSPSATAAPKKATAKGGRSK